MNEYERRHQLSIKLKEQYPPGTRVLLNQMDDPHHPVESGTRGTVVHVDDQANMHMKWDNGRTLALDPELDSFRKLTGEEIAEENPQYTICQINVDENPDLAMEFGVSTIPNLIVMENGAIIKQIAGARTKAAILKMLEE